MCLAVVLTVLRRCRLVQAGQSSFCTPASTSSWWSSGQQTMSLDPLLVYAFIRTESGFDPQATSTVDARGLMQMTEETFLWMRSKIAPEEPLTFADLYSPDTAIRFGCYYLHLCMVRYNGDVSTAAAAYHSGWGTVDQLLQIEEHSADGETLQGFPYNQMHHYVNKITACYQTYQRLYAGQ
ncbi:MAG: lytic transglycosylase domain-containing protein [Faecalibacterium prausnitzii]